MKRKALLSMIIAMGICAAFTGCGKTDDEVSNGTEQPSYNEAMGIIDSEVTGAVVTPHDVIAPEAFDIEPTQEILEADMDSFKVQLGNKVYTLPVTLQTILDDGATITNDVNPINEVVYPGFGGYVELTIDNVPYALRFENEFENDKQLKDCILDDIFENDGETKQKNVILPKGIREGTSVADLKAKWGEPNGGSLDQLSYMQKYKHPHKIVGEYTGEGIKYWYIFNIDIEKQIITTISVSVGDDDYYRHFIDEVGDIANLVDVTESSETSAKESESEAPTAEEESIETSTAEE